MLVVINNADVSDSQPAGVCTKGPECYMIRGFSRMYLEGCSHADSAPFPVVRTVAECEAQVGVASTTSTAASFSSSTTSRSPAS